MKRALDICVSSIGLIALSPILLIFVIAVWLQDFKNPFYIAERVGQFGRPFSMIKLRSMVYGADKSGVTSTANSDLRITFVGRLIRKLKLDETAQLWNVLVADMSLVGPRPNVQKWGVDLYTNEEMRLLTVLPGITDFSSIVFADEGSILSGSANPDLKYNQVVRPWKSRLSLLYVDNVGVWLDIKLVAVTVASVFSRTTALSMIQNELRKLDAPKILVEIAARNTELVPYPPPGSSEIATI